MIAMFKYLNFRNYTFVLEIWGPGNMFAFDIREWPAELKCREI